MASYPTVTRLVVRIRVDLPKICIQKLRVPQSDESLAEKEEFTACASSDYLVSSESYWKATSCKMNSGSQARSLSWLPPLA